ncbi:hypothetical protein M436DRAFT_50641 [Aureobasidium namibiae CBS 147.97]|uniref:Exocyst complex component Sec3 PIP2-binding N-terminal domain-containing protein n=1 Tax=Aureobasidium namibiae CBS 147.97 TaxID=1043004 RepID=A0A074XAD6_9PEZI|nr:uncharacterized protein M436DRAFT_50641 [Aureobasidium namibiae CBS 147.97]KEQ71586.1 hypothetical protein M436DRAFT_50641 [Aureobasidium namibiae CBS 147.97]
MTRAERFEDEKRRMVESCFSKLDQNGQLAESYITHIRITEDAAHPSTPPPPTSAPDNKKPRIVVVAVRSTGRVRMHKARENNNGSFSIGKTWNLEDLSAIESFAHPDPNAPPPKQNHYQWAGSVGFVVTISKPYYWAAATSKEKDFFVASLVKIYRKYTKGQVPDLRGFDPRDVEQMLGLAPGQQQAPRSSPAVQDRQTPQNTPPPRPPFAEQHRPSSQDSRPRFRPTPENGEPLPPGGLQPQPRPSQDKGMRQRPSRERMRAPSREPMRAPSREPMRAPSRDPGRAQSREPAQRGAAPPPLNNVSMFTSTLNQWKPPSREASPMRQPSPRKPHITTVEQSEPRPSVFETLKNQRQPALRPPPLSTSRNVSGASTNISTVATVGRPSSPQPEPLQASSLPFVQPEESQPAVLEQRDVLSDEEEHRPGLGPMIKKKPGPKLADALRKAAAAQGAFKPRAGGAAERMRALAEAANKGQGPDGINGVVPAPLRKQSVDIDRSELPVQAHTPIDGAAVEGYFPQPEPEAQPEEPQVPVPAPEPRRPKRRSAQQENHLRSLNIDPRLLDGRGIQFESILSDFGWGSGLLKGRQLEDLEADLKRELGRVEAGSWLGHLEQKDDRVDVVDQMLDRAIAECDELDGLLTIYSAELSTLNEDISFIEAQSQGLQVQTANQKILHTELQKLVDTISISPRQLEPLRHGDFSNPEALMSVESSLLLLYKAMATIDPSVRSTNALSRPGPGLDASDVGNMKALQEKRNAYMRESAEFCQRLMRYLDNTFASALAAAKPSLMQHPGGIGNATMKLNGSGFNLARANLWQFSPLLLFTKETNLPAWQSTLRTYQTKARPLYTDVFRDNTSNWKRGARTAGSEATELLFTSVEKETPEGLTSTARKLTVKRSQTLAKSFRSAGTGGDKPTAVDRAQPGRMAPFEVFNGVLEEQVPLISMEQNFIVDLFHATSLENIDFADAVVANVPEARMGSDLTTRRLMEPDRAMARRVSDTMEETFGFWKDELRALMEWANAGDPIQGVGVLTVLALHAYRLQETSQEFLLHNLNEISSRLQTLFQKFVDEQIHAIEDTKVKIKKRKGVIAFMKIFPLFSNAVESTYLSAARDHDGHAAVLGARQLVDDAYIRINRAMWDSLKVIARESPTATGAAASATTAHGLEYEDKEILNYHILLIENMNHYIEEVDDGGVEGSVLAEWKAKALMDRAEHMEEYVGRVVRRPLGKIIDFVEGAETLLSQNLSGPTISSRPLYSRHNTKKLLASHDSKAIRSGIDALRKRIEKHFGDADEEVLSRQMVAMVCKECERRYDSVLDRLVKACDVLYKENEKGVVIDWSKEDTREGFKRV